MSKAAVAEKPDEGKETPKDDGRVKEAMREVKCKEFLECRLSEPELKDCAKKLADSLDRKTQTEARVESFKTQAKADIAKLDAEISKMTSLVNTEKEYRQVECVIIFDFKAGAKRIVREDTGEVVRTANISDEERQRKFWGE